MHPLRRLVATNSSLPSLAADSVRAIDEFIASGGVLLDGVIVELPISAAVSLDQVSARLDRLVDWRFPIRVTGGVARHIVVRPGAPPQQLLLVEPGGRRTLTVGREVAIVGHAEAAGTVEQAVVVRGAPRTPLMLRWSGPRAHWLVVSGSHDMYVRAVRASQVRVYTGLPVGDGDVLILGAASIIVEVLP